MRQFAKLLLVTLGFGMLGFVMSLVPQRTAAGPGAAPVNIVSSIPLTVGVNNFPSTLTGASVPVSGKVNATIVGTPTVTFSSSQPVPTLGVEALTSFVADNSCAFLNSIDCHIAPIYTVPAGKIAVIESVGGFCSGTAPFAIIFLEIDFTGTDGQPKLLRFSPGAAVPTGGGFNANAWGLNLKTYAAGGTTGNPINFLAEETAGSTNSDCNFTVSGYLVSTQ
jgi:hypothetical protein